MSEVYLLSGGLCVRYDMQAESVVGEAQSLGDLWPGLAGDYLDGIDAALNYGNGKVYFFKGDSYVRIDIATKQVEIEPTLIAGNWPGLSEAGFADGIQAAVNYGNGTVYFFKGTSYVGYDIATDVAGQPGAMSDWSLLTESGFGSDIDAAVNYGNGKLYLFKGDNYLRFDLASATVDNGPYPIADYWAGTADAGFAASLRGSWCTAAQVWAQPVEPQQPAQPQADGGAVPTALSSGADIDALFVARTGQGFIDWFNATQAGQGAWAQRRMNTDDDTRARFLAFWNNIPVVFGQDSIRLEQFVALQSIILNELGGSMTPVSERMGYSGHPGIAYLFDVVDFGSWKKASYNTGSAGKTALVCFNDADFLEAHQALAFHAELAHTGDQVWAGNSYPQDRYPTDMGSAGIIAEADFCKFRGRGMIQTTWRSAYKSIISFIQGYDGPNSVVQSYRSAWSGLHADAVAFKSSNADWDQLFQASDYVIPSAAIRLHSQGAGGYLQISEDPATRGGQDQGSFYNMGRRISGSGQYGTLFSQRCQQILAAFPA